MLSREVTNAAASTRISVSGDVQISVERATAAGGARFHVLDIEYTSNLITRF